MIVCLCWSSMAIYLISQGKGQLTIILNAQPIDKIMQDISFPDSLKQKLNLITEIKQYAVDSIGINPNDSYSTVFDQHNRSILFTVSACEPYSFKAKEWSFPLLGIVSYKGFFNKSEAEIEIKNLKLKGYDVDVYSPTGWSTLGWFKDPILSNMLYKSEGQLANLIIHELTHGTIYIKNNVEFNENLANFIGDKGAEKFLINKYGISSKQYLNYLHTKSDEYCFREYILQKIERLDSLYLLLSTIESDKIKEQKKIKIITEIVLGVNRLPLFKRKEYFKYSFQAFEEKNAFFMAFSRYDSQYDVFDKEFKKKYRLDLRRYLSFYKEKFR